MSQRQPHEASRLSPKLLIAAAVLAAVAFPTAAEAGGLTTPHAASAPVLTTPKAAPSAPAAAPGGSSGGGASPAGKGDSPAPAPAPSGDLNGNPFRSEGSPPASANSKSPDDLNGNPFQLTEEQRLEMDVEAAANFFSPGDRPGSEYLPEEPEPFQPQSLFGILPIDLGGPLYNFLQITEQIENGDHNGATF